MGFFTKVVLEKLRGNIHTTKEERLVNNELSMYLKKLEKGTK